MRLGATNAENIWKLHFGHTLLERIPESDLFPSLLRPLSSGQRGVYCLDVARIDEQTADKDVRASISAFTRCA